jgi:competence protein ComEA
VRVLRLLGERAPQPAGWTPAQVRAAHPWVPAAGPGEGAAGEPVGPAAPAAAPTSVRALLQSGRIDPGRRGAVALAAVAVLSALVAALVVLRGRPSEQPLTVPPVVGASAAAAGAEIVVDVAGRVRRPGLVHLPAGARVDDALRAAGGALPGAPTGLLNLARRLADGEQVLVAVAAAGPVGAAAGPAALLDLNTATVQDFDALPGIGPVLADRIVAWRSEHRRFASVDQLREVSGIGESKYQSLKAKVRV